MTGAWPPCSELPTRQFVHAARASGLEFVVTTPGARPPTARFTSCELWRAQASMGYQRPW